MTTETVALDTAGELMLRFRRYWEFVSRVIRITEGSIMKQLIFTLLCVLIACAAMAASTAKVADPDQLITVDLELSRPQLVAGEGLAIVARIRNVSKIPVFLRESSFTMTQPLELEGSRASVAGYSAYFPTELHKEMKPGEEPPTTNEYFKEVIRLNPGDSYSAFWTNTFTGGQSSSMAYLWSQITSQFQFLFFTPGRYTFTLTAKYWTEQALPAENYRLLSKTISVPVVAPLMVILFGAAIGGLLAHFVLPQAVPAPSANQGLILRISRRIAAMAGSALLSVIVTIVLSRVAETQFLISVTVNDVWGAVVTGFVANYFGYKALAKILPNTGDDQLVLANKGQSQTAETKS